MRTPDDVKALLETVFQRIQAERMTDVPILNDMLDVEAVGFESCDDDSLLGVLITPWFMNLMLLPAEAGAWEGQVNGEKSTLDLPGGSFEFIAGSEDGIGEFRMCSLFSPVLEFGDHETAHTCAATVMEGVLRPADDEAAAATTNEAARPPTLSRRDLFRSLAGAE